MIVQIGPCQLQLIQGDITQQNVDAIVNAANSALAGGGGVDGAIHRAGGPGIMQETRTNYPDGCPPGTAVITSGGNLPAKYVIHTVGPIWRGGLERESEVLAAAYENSLKLAVAHGCQSVAFPALSTGAFGYPLDLAADVALNSIVEFLRENDGPELVQIVLFDAGAYGAFAYRLEEIREASSQW